MDIFASPHLFISLKKTAYQYPNKVCLLLNDKTCQIEITYQQLLEKINYISGQLSNCQPGERIILLTDNCPEGMVFYFSILAANATPILIDPNLVTDELKNLIHQADAHWIIGSEKYLNKLDLHINSEKNVCFANQTYKGVCTKKEVDESDYNPNIAAILFTSGTTAQPKGVMLTHNNIQAAIKGSIPAIEITANDRMLSILPIFHISSLLQNILCLLVGCPVICISKLDAAELSSTLVMCKPTMIGVVPLILDRFYQNIKTSLSKISKINQGLFALILLFGKVSQSAQWLLFSKINAHLGGQLAKIICGGATANPKTVNKLKEMGFKVIEAYGLTETCGPICSTLPNTKKHASLTPFSTVEIKIDNPNQHGEGELCVRSEAVMSGYFRDLNATRQAIKDDWFYTKDIGSFTNGLVKILGRTQELIILPSGKKIQPTEIEKQYQQIPNVTEFAIFKMPPHFPTGNTLNAAVVMEKASLTAQKQIEDAFYNLGSKLPTHMQISRVYFLKELPKTNLKIKRNTLPDLVKEQIIDLSNKTKPTRHKSADIEKWLLVWISKKNNITVSQQDKHQSFIYFGLDSLAIIQMCGALEAWLKIKVDPTLIWRYSTIHSLATFLAGEEVSVGLDTQRGISQEPIAIVGIACRFPGAENMEELWELLIHNQSAITDIPLERWNSEEFYARTITPGKMNTCRGGFVKDIYGFDANFFEISLTEAENIDPQHRLLLELTWEALESSGICAQPLFKSDTGVYVGISANDYGTLSARKIAINALGPYNAIGNNLSAAAGRISYFFGLQGICKSIDTACSSSLVAVHDACADLQLGKTQLAIVGGINTILSPLTTIMLSQAHMLSPEGQCKVFDAEANGYVRSEGGAVILLKRLSDALRDNDPIHAVIRGAAVNQDGRSNGLTAPNSEAQIKLFQQNLKNAGLSTQDIDFIEAHGTGTPLGDPIETQSIDAVFKGRGENNPILLGSIKSNIGHLEAGAGIAGLIKAILVLQNQLVPAQINLNKLNPLIENLKNIRILRQNMEINLKFAAVNSFGFTGVNSQVILEKAPTVNKVRSEDKPYYLIVLSAKNNDALKIHITNLLSWINHKAKESIILNDLAYTLAMRRNHFNKRCALIINSLDELKQTLTQLGANQYPNNYFDLEHNNIGTSTDIVKKTLIEYAQNYVRGEEVRWNALFPTRFTSLTDLPTYPFKRQRYCSPFLDNLKNTLHPLLAQSIQDDNHFQSQTNFTDPLPNYIAEHKIFNMPVMAGAVSISAFISLLNHCKKANPIFIKDLHFLQPIVFDVAEPKWLTVRLNTLQDNHYQLEVISSGQKNLSQFQLHVTAIAAANTILPLENISLQDYQQSCNKTYSTADFYHEVRKINIEYGAAYQCLDEICIGQDIVLAKLKSNQDSRFILSPGQIDSIFQLLFILFKDSGATELFVPYKIHQIYLMQPEKVVWVVAKKNPTNESDKRADFYLFDQDGKVVGCIQDFIAKKFNPIFFNNKLSNSTEKLTYLQENWEVSPLTVESSQVMRPWLMVSHTDLKLPEINTIHVTDMTANNFASCLPEMGGVFYHLESVQADSLENIQSFCNTAFKRLVNSLQVYINQKSFDKPFWIIAKTEMVTYSVFGLIKSILMEYPTISLHVLLYSTDASHIPFSSEIHANRPETFIRYQNNQREVLRLNTYTLANKKDNVLLFPANEYYRLNFPSNGIIQNLSLDAFTLREIQDEEVKIEVKAVGINFRDLLSILKLYPGEVGPLGSDFAGIVTEIGKNVSHIKVGDAVLGFTATDALASFAISHEKLIIKKPEHLSFEEAATIPSTFLTAHLALNVLANIKANDKVLIHAASGGVGIAAIQLVQLIGAEIFATAGNDEKRTFLKSLGVKHIYDSRSILFAEQIRQDTEGEGVDVVLNCLSGANFIESSLSICGSNARFLEIGKRNIWSTEEMQKHRPDIEYHIIALDEVVKQQPDFILQMNQVIMRYFEQKCLNALPITHFKMNAAIDAFRYMQQAKHIGKIVIGPKKIVQPIHEDGSYLITGGLGGLGIVFAEWLMQQGAKHIVITSRNTHSIAKEKLLNLAKIYNGLDLQIIQNDISEPQQLQTLFAKFGNEWPTLKGIIHAAGVIKDGAFVKQSWQDFETIFHSKVLGAWLLHQYSLSHHLDFFVLFSSVASAFGSAGQANYAVGNAFLDNLARLRRSMNLPALSINWGPWREVGLAKDIVAMMEQFGFTPMTNSKGIALFEEAIQQDVATLIAAPLNITKMRQLLPSTNTIFNNLLKDIKTETNKQLLLTKIKEVSAAELGNSLQIALQEVLADILGLEPHQVDATTTFAEFGMDSLMMLKMQDMLETHLGKHILPSIESLSEYPSIDKLASFIEQQLSADPVSKTVVCIPMINKEESIRTKDQIYKPILSAETIAEIETYTSKLFNPSSTKRWFKKIINPVLSFFIKLYIRTEVNGLENLPINKPFILCANHTSYLDAVVFFLTLGKRSNDLIGLLAEDYFDKKMLISTLSCVGNIIPFDRSNNPAALLKNLTFIEKCKNANKSLLLFPEGTRSEDGQLKDFKQGVSWFLEQTGMLVVPAYIQGAHQLMPKQRRIPKPGKVKIVFDAPINIKEFNKDNYPHEKDFYAEITNSIRVKIQMMAEKTLPEISMN